MRKRIISIMIMLLLTSQAAFAQNVSFEDCAQESRLLTGGMLSEVKAIAAAEEEYSFSFFNTLSFEEYIVAAAEEMPEKIENLSQYEIQYTDFEDKYFSVVMRHPELLMKTACEYWYNEGTGIVTSVKPVYLVETEEERKTAREAMETELQEYLDLAAGYNNDVEKLIVIHDKMVADCVYDERVLKEETKDQAPDTVYHALGVLRDKWAVCQGYSQALYMIGERLGIELDFCKSNEVNHMWNYVKLDGKWYHMDMTNDDPADSQGRANHTYFLVSDDSLIPEGHGNSWRRYEGEAYDCKDKKYETDHLFNVIIPFTAKREADGLFHIYAGLNGIPVDFRSESLYTGAVIDALAVADGKYSVIENNVVVEKEGTNLYLMQYATRDVPKLQPIIKWEDNSIGLFPAQQAFSKHNGYIKLIKPDVEDSVLPDFTVFLWDSATLEPYSVKTVWSND